MVHAEAQRARRAKRFYETRLPSACSAVNLFCIVEEDPESHRGGTEDAEIGGILRHPSYLGVLCASAVNLFCILEEDPESHPGGTEGAEIGGILRHPSYLGVLCASAVNLFCIPEEVPGISPRRHGGRRDRRFLIGNDLHGQRGETI